MTLELNYQMSMKYHKINQPNKNIILKKIKLFISLKINMKYKKSDI